MSMAGGKFTWNEAWRSPSFRISFIVTFSVLFLIAFYVGGFFDFIEDRNGPQLNDSVLAYLPATDVSWIVFLFLYSGIVIGLYSLRQNPSLILLMFQTYILVTIMRLLSLFFFPLNPPNDYIALREPVAQFFANHHRIISHDLFFSGHVSTICSVLFAVRNKIVKRFVFVCAVAVSILVLVQRVHYTIDVLAAPVATYVSYLIARRFFKQN